MMEMYYFLGAIIAGLVVAITSLRSRCSKLEEHVEILFMLVVPLIAYQETLPSGLRVSVLKAESGSDDTSETLKSDDTGSDTPKH